MRALLISDLHCGHWGGLTPPEYWYPTDDADPIRRHFARIQRIMWRWYEKVNPAFGPFDALICNGDAIEGKGERSGGKELLTADRRAQCQMAAKAIRLAGAKRIHIIRGTPYHTGKEEDWEDVLAGMVDAEDVTNRGWYEHEGVVTECRHRVSSSIIPHGRHTAPSREAMWNALQAERGLQPHAHIMARSHVHYHIYNGDARRVVFTTPALQADTDYGSRMMSGTIDLGVMVIDIDGPRRYRWRAELMDMQFLAARTRAL